MLTTFTIDVSFDEGDIASLADAEKIAAVAIPPVLEKIRDVWVGAVSGGHLLGMTRVVTDAQYAAALTDPAALVYPDASPLAGAVQIPHGPAYDTAVRLERGRKPRDMKPALLAGSHAKRGKHGRYNVIPLGFKAPTPGAFGPGFMAGLFHATSPFRTVSDRSPADSWIYPGLPPAGVIDAVATAAEGIVEDTVSRALENFYGNTTLRSAA